MIKARWRASLAAVAVLALVGAAQPALARTGENGTFRDDFDTLSSAWTMAAGDWQASDGAARVVTPGSTRGSVLALTELGLEPVSTATATFRTEGGGATAWAGFTVHRAGTTDDYTQSGYTVLVRNNGELAVIKAAGNSAVTILGATPTAARPGTEWVTVTARLDGDRLDVSLGGAAQPRLSVTDSSFDDGGFSLAAHRDLRMVVDAVELTGVAERDEPAPADCIAWSGEPAATAERGLVLNSPERIAEVARRADRGVEPQASGFDRLMADVSAGMARTPAPPEVFFVPFFYNNPTAHRAARDGLQNDANTAYQLALAYRLTGDESYGAHAAEFIGTDGWPRSAACAPARTPRWRSATTSPRSCSPPSCSAARRCGRIRESGHSPASSPRRPLRWQARSSIA